MFCELLTANKRIRQFLILCYNYDNDIDPLAKKNKAYYYYVAGRFFIRIYHMLTRCTAIEICSSFQ